MDRKLKQSNGFLALLTDNLAKYVGYSLSSLIIFSIYAEDVFTKYKLQVEQGTMDKSLQTADLDAVEVALANILAHRGVALQNGENSHEKSKRMVREQRFRHRLLKDAGLMEWPMENEEKF